MKKLTKSNDRIIAGVCGGIAEYFGFDATIVRLVTAALALFTAIVPSDVPSDEPGLTDVIADVLHDGVPVVIASQ